MTVKNELRNLLKNTAPGDVSMACDYLRLGTPPDEGAAALAAQIQSAAKTYSLDELQTACDGLFSSGGGAGSFPKREAFRERASLLCVFFRRLANERDLATPHATRDELAKINSRDPREAFRACGHVLDRAFG